MASTTQMKTHHTYLQKYTLTRQEIFKHYDQKAVNPHKTWHCAKYHSKTSVCLEDNINNENPAQPVISAYMGALFKATICLCFSYSHLGSADL